MQRHRFGITSGITAKVGILTIVAAIAAIALTGVAGGSPGQGPSAGVGGIVPPIVTPQQGGGNLIYHGGPVMHTNKTYAIYWVPSGYSMSASYKTLIDRYFSDVAAASGQNTNVYSVEKQYYDLAPNPNPGPIQYNSTFGGSVTVTNAFPANGCQVYDHSVCLSDSQLITQINTVVAAQGWVKNASAQFFLFTPQNVDSCFGSTPSSGCSYTDYCAYHGYSGSLIYANQPYAAEPGCDTGERPNGDDADPTINVTSHEHREAINDFQLNAWYDNQGFEGSDKCAWDFGSPIFGPPGGHYNQTINGHNYYLQQEWSNDGSTCRLAYSGSPSAPTITSFSPTSGPVGTIVTVNGTNFTGTTAVKFNTTSASFQVLGPTQLRAAVPAGATTGKISVTNPSGTGQSATNFTVTGGTGAPTVSSFSPTSGAAGTIVTVNGSNFTGVTAVKFNGKAAAFQVSSSTKLYAQVPSGATTGPISVTNGSGTGTSSTNFTVTGGGGAPIVSSFTPTSGPIGTIVTVNGTGFTGTTAVKFNGTSAQFLVSSSTKLYARVPSGATTGKISVTTPGGTGTSATNFTVT